VADLGKCNHVHVSLNGTSRKKPMKILTNPRTAV